MEIHCRPLNSGEMFCCSAKKAKDIFKDTEIHIDFAYLGRDFSTFAETPDAYYCKRCVKGRVIASLFMQSNNKKAILSFYVLKESMFSYELKKEFEQVHLPEFYRLYQNLINDHTLSRSNVLMLVELIDGKLKLHETALKWK